MENERGGGRMREERGENGGGGHWPLPVGGREQEEGKGAGLCMCHTRLHLYYCDSNYFLSQVSFLHMLFLILIKTAAGYTFIIL